MHPGLTARAHLWQITDRPDQAVADLKKAIELDPRNAHAYAERGLLFTTVKDYDKAIPDFGRAIQLGCRSTWVTMGLATIHLNRRELDKAKTSLENTIQIDPNHVTARVELGIFHLMRSNFTEALAALNKAIEIDPRCDMVYGVRATVALALGKYDQAAIDDLNEAIALNPQSSLYFRNRAASGCFQEKWQLALADVETAIRLDPKNAEAQRSRAWILAVCPIAKIRNYQKALTLAVIACDLTTWKNPNHLRTLAIACSETGDFAAAVQWQQRAIDILPTNDSRRSEFHELLKRYQAGKPYHRLGLLQEIGIQSVRGESQRP